MGLRIPNLLLGGSASYGVTVSTYDAASKTLSGKAGPYVPVLIKKNGADVVTVNADADGNWSTVLATALISGADVVTASAPAGSNKFAYNAPPPLVSRVSNQGASIMEQGVSGGSGVVRFTTMARKLPKSFKRSRMHVPVFTVNGQTDEFFSNIRSFQRGINPVFANGKNGRLLYKISGNSTLSYNPATWDKANLVKITTDWLDHDTIPAGQEFEISNGIRTPAGQLPYTHTLYGDVQTGARTVTNNTDTMGADALATFDAWFPVTNSPSGGVVYDNGILEIECEDGTACLVSFGDSNDYAFGYDVGDANGNAGILTRGAARRGIFHLNLGKGGDGNFAFGVDIAKGALRRKLAKDIHVGGLVPNKVFTSWTNANGTNDITKSPVIANYANDVDVEWGKHLNAPNGGQYFCTKAGRTKASGQLTGTGRNIVDGTAEFSKIDGLGNGGADQKVGYIVASEMRANAWIRDALPGVKALGWAMLPYSIVSNDNWATSAGQTSPEIVSRPKINNLRKTVFDLFGYSGCIDPNPYVEEGSTGKVKTDGVTPLLFVVNDGRHFNAFGSSEGSKSFDGVDFQ